MKYLITGGAGFLGSNLASKVLSENEELFIFDNLYKRGTHENLKWLMEQGNVNFVHSDIRNKNDVETAIKSIEPDVIFHLAGQISMTSSVADPRMDFEVNTVGTFNLLNAIRLYSPKSIIVYSSTNKVYGDLERFDYKETDKRYVCTNMPNGFDEHVNLDFRSPYGTSKGSADQYMLDFYRIYGIRTVVFRHSSMYGKRQFATYEQGWIAWFCMKALEIKKGSSNKLFTISGNGKQVRDILYISDVANLYFNTVKNIEQTEGQAFNIGGGIENSFSLLELFSFLEKELDIKMNYTKLPQRACDQKVFISDNSKAKEIIGWYPKVSKEEGIRKTIEWVE